MVIKSESEYQKEFLKFVRKHHFFKGSDFAREVPLFYDVKKKKKEKDFFCPDCKVDFVELDKEDRFHLWEAKLLHKEDLIKGKVLGQLLFYDFYFSTYDEEDLTSILIKKGIPKERFSKMKRKKYRPHSWNIVVCGGEGWEIAAGVNPIMWTYHGGLDHYLKKPNHINVFHFFKTSKGFDLKSLWELSVLSPKHMNRESFEKYLQGREGDKKLKIPKDALKVAESVYRSKKGYKVLNKFIGRDWFRP